MSKLGYYISKSLRCKKRSPEQKFMASLWSGRRGLSCSLACNGNSKFWFRDFITQQNFPASARSLRTQKRDSHHYHPNYKEPTGIKPIDSLWSGRRGSNSRHPPWQGGILPLNYPRLILSLQETFGFITLFTPA